MIVLIILFFKNTLELNSITGREEWEGNLEITSHPVDQKK